MNCQKGIVSDNEERDKVNYYYYLRAYHQYVKNSLSTLRVWGKFPDSYSVNKLIEHLAFQIDSHFKTHLLKYIIQHEFTLLKRNGYLIGNTDEEKELSYIHDISNTEDWLYYIFEKYPLIENLFCSFTKNTITYIDAILNDYINDREQINSYFKKGSILSDIELFLGDSHSKGKFVSKITFENGLTLMYKPRRSHNDRILKDLLTSLKSSGIEIFAKIPKSLEINGHSWCEYIYPNDVTEDFSPDLYYNNLGKLLCVLHTIGASDIISDNIICADGIPAIIDLECILRENIINQELSLFSNYYNHSIINIGILPVWKYSSMNERNTLSSVLFKSTTNNHLPKRNIEVFEISSQTKKTFLRGFSDCYDILSKLDLSFYNRCFENCNQRLIIQDTSLYSFLQREMLLPEYLHGDKDIRPLINKSIPAVFSKHIHNFSDSILNQLLNYDIPSFYVDQNSNIIDGYGCVIASMKNLTTNKRALSYNDKIAQCKIIDSSIEQILVEKDEHKAAKPIDYNSYKLASNTETVKDNCHIASVKVARELFNLRLELGDEVNWIAKGTSRLDGRYQTDILDESLYSGKAGMALLFAKIGVTENIHEYQQLSNVLFNNIIGQFYRLNIEQPIERLKKHNLINAISYHSFPLCCLFLACHDKTIFSIGNSLANKIIHFTHKNCLHNVKDCGYLGGLAGYLDFLLEVKRSDYYNVPDTLIIEAYKKLISQEKIKKGLSHWPHIESTGTKVSSAALGGFSHGSSGIAYVLFKFFKIMGDDDAYTRFIRTLNHDRTYFDTASKSWRDGRRNKNNQDMSAWCHGAGGIGLSRALLMQEGFNDSSIKEEMQDAVNVIKKNLGYNQCVCHGDLGNLEILRIIGETMNDCSISEYAVECANAIALRVINEEELVYGDGSILPTIGLFLGKAGIAYQLLRFAHWESVPSVLFLNLSKSRYAVC